MARKRLDERLVEQGLAPTRARARALILAGKVTVNGKMADKAGLACAEKAEIRLKSPDHPYVSRGGVKLAGALVAFGIDVTGTVNFQLQPAAQVGEDPPFPLEREAERIELQVPGLMGRQHLVGLEVGFLDVELLHAGGDEDGGAFPVYLLG